MQAQSADPRLFQSAEDQARLLEDFLRDQLRASLVSEPDTTPQGTERRRAAWRSQWKQWMATFKKFRPTNLPMAAAMARAAPISSCTIQRQVQAPRERTLLLHRMSKSPLVFLVPGVLSAPQCDTLVSFGEVACSDMPSKSWSLENARGKRGLGRAVLAQADDSSNQPVLDVLDELRCVVPSLIGSPLDTETDECRLTFTAPETAGACADADRDAAEDERAGGLHAPCAGCTGGLHIDTHQGVARWATLLVYLNDVPPGLGGETVFPCAIEHADATAGASDLDCSGVVGSAVDRPTKRQRTTDANAADASDRESEQQRKPCGTRSDHTSSPRAQVRARKLLVDASVREAGVQLSSSGAKTTGDAWSCQVQGENLTVEPTAETFPAAKLVAAAERAIAASRAAITGREQSQLEQEAGWRPMGAPRDTESSDLGLGGDAGLDADAALCVQPCKGTGVLFFSVLPPPLPGYLPVSAADARGATATNMPESTGPAALQDPYSWHGGAAVGAAGKWTLQVFCEIPPKIRNDAALVDTFLRERFNELAVYE